MTTGYSSFAPRTAAQAVVSQFPTRTHEENALATADISQGERVNRE